ncbi:S8 family serine peptidase [Streptomyces ipomoeae]|uniref:S8 family serine peptidase n=1 Tax=Streptomyces ipomoeae TaxID=103232 RepID=UPI0011470074|nr:S8 family serine peptidase [Streptomyces ipomoeae]MDX2935517.1 S8 family serine peptidase [Streptomyces ipomoeae]TQE18348.1 serine protease [Streptomyces ipomoeae]
MPPTTPHVCPIPGARRLTRIAVVAGLTAVLTTTGLIPLDFAAEGHSSAERPKSAHDKLGSADAELLAEAEATGEKNVTMMIATAPGKTEQVAEELDAVKGGSVGRTYDKLGYVRATVPTGRADAAIAAAVKLSSVHGIDLRDEIQLEDPLPAAHRGNGGAVKATSDTYPGPGKGTSAENPYNPSFETGAVDFVKKHPKADGRGVTIGVLDTGVDLASPALQKTTTGERKIVDWVTATDPIVDGDGTWRAMTTDVSGPAFTFGGQSWKAPSGSYRVNVFRESVTKGGRVEDGLADGDANRDGDTTDSWGVLYDPAAGTVTVDLNNDHDFTDDEPMKPYKDAHQIGWFGTDDPETDIAERQPFVVEIRKNVPMDPLGGDWVGKKSDFVNIGVVSKYHGTHVAGIAAANGLFGGKMNGAAPGAKIVSSRACIFGAGCTNVALAEGMIDLVVNRGIDIVNMSIGGLPALNDGNNARAELYRRLIDTYGVQLVIAAGNSGPGANTIDDPALADKVISVGAGVSKETWAANYGSEVEKEYGLFTFSARGPREDGGFAPTLVAPGSAVSSSPSWMPGSQLFKQYTGWNLPAGYTMYQGTSMASPQTAGASALLLSAAKQQGVGLTPVKLRTALTSTARHIKGLQAYEEGAGLIDIQAAWKKIQEGANAHEYTVKAPVDTALDQVLKTPGFGTGIYDREGGLKAGQKETYEVTLTRTSGPHGPVPHTLRLKNNKSRTFSLLGSQTVALPLNRPVTVKVQAAPTSEGIKSARLEIDDPTTVGVDEQVLTTVVVSTPAEYTYSASESVQRNSTDTYFVTVPEGANNLEVRLGGLKDGSRTVASAIHPYGLPVKDDDPATPDVAAYPDPQAGVWEIVVQSSYASKLLDNPYDLDVTVYRTSFDPEPATVPEAKAGTPAAVSWTAENEYAPVNGTVKGGPLGSSRTTRPTIATGDTQTTMVEVPESATSLDVAIGNPSDKATDLDLRVYDADGDLVGMDADNDAEESVSVPRPAAGTYTIEVLGFDVPSGSTAYDYRDVFFSTALGSLTPDDAGPVRLGTGASATVSAHVTAVAAAPEGRALFGEVHLLNDRGTFVGKGTVKIGKVTP